MLKQKKIMMIKNIIFFGESGIFSETLKNMAETEGMKFYDYPSWQDCSSQFYEIKPAWVFIDLDTFNISSLDNSVEEVQCVFFTSSKDNLINWDSNFYIEYKPLEVVKFQSFLREVINGQR